jgi:hypothetical protein
MRSRSLKYSTISFIQQANIVHKNKFDYSKSIYTGSKKKLIIICPIHGEFKQIAQVHLFGSGCTHCWYKRSGPKLKAIKIKKVKVNKPRILKIAICEKHNFYLKKEKYIKGLECDCFSNHDNKTNKFIIKAKLKHFKYNYSLVNYKHCLTKVRIYCFKHGVFKQTPNDHLSGKGCPKCSKIISNKETTWLDSYNIPIQNRNKRIVLNDKYYCVDGIDYESNTIYEFNGDYWHGNPDKYNPEDINTAVNKKFKDLYLDTINKQKRLEEAGYKVISIWESDFDKVNKK